MAEGQTFVKNVPGKMRTLLRSSPLAHNHVTMAAHSCEGKECKDDNQPATTWTWNFKYASLEVLRKECCRRIGVCRPFETVVWVLLLSTSSMRRPYLQSHFWNWSKCGYPSSDASNERREAGDEYMSRDEGYQRVVFEIFGGDRHGDYHGDSTR